MRKVPLAEIVPGGRTAQQCRAVLRRKGFAPNGKRWEFTPKKADKIERILLGL